MTQVLTGYRELNPPPDSELIETDGLPMDSEWHGLNMNLLCAVVDYHLRDRKDYYVGGNMFIYFSAEEARNRDFRGPDFFFVKGRPREPQRLYWAVWNEDYHYPNVIIELVSPTTAEEDLTTKKRVYERVFCTPDYYCYDPDKRTLKGWRLSEKGRYRQLRPNARGWLWSEELGLWLGTWHGKYLGPPATYLRFFDADGQLVPLESEAEKARAEEAQARADAAQAQAGEARARAQAAEEEIARLKALLAQAQPPPSRPNGPAKS
jgi:Uma2 family endonuclease